MVDLDARARCEEANGGVSVRAARGYCVHEHRHVGRRREEPPRRAAAEDLRRDVAQVVRSAIDLRRIESHAEERLTVRRRSSPRERRESEVGKLWDRVDEPKAATIAAAPVAAVVREDALRVRRLAVNARGDARAWPVAARRLIVVEHRRDAALVAVDLVQRAAQRARRCAVQAHVCERREGLVVRRVGIAIRVIEAVRELVNEPPIYGRAGLVHAAHARCG